MNNILYANWVKCKCFNLLHVYMWATARYMYIRNTYMMWIDQCKDLPKTNLKGYYIFPNDVSVCMQILCTLLRCNENLNLVKPCHRQTHTFENFAFPCLWCLTLYTTIKVLFFITCTFIEMKYELLQNSM